MASPCPKCSGVEWDYGSTTDKGRAVQFSVFGGLVAALGLALILLQIPMWPWWCFGTAAFILSQAALKWSQYVWRRCKACNYQTNDWAGRK